MARFRFSFALLASLALVACDSNDADITPTPQPGTRFGEAQAIGNGTARTYMALDADGVPTAVGVSFTAAALEGLPGESAGVLLALPEGAREAGILYENVDFGWNPHGHEPENLFTIPHFDVHFYMVTEAERMTWMPTNPDFMTAGQRAPDARYIPAGYILPPGPPVPAMGNHMVDTSDPTYAPGGPAFTEVFIWGSYDGEVIFAEPMMTKAFLEAMQPGDVHQETLAQPEAWAESGLHPTTYAIHRDATTGEYRVELGGLTQRAGS